MQCRTLRRVLYKLAVVLYKGKAGFRGGQVAQVFQPLPPTGGKASRFLGYPKTQLATIKTNTLTDIRIVVYTTIQIVLNSKARPCRAL